MPNLIQLPHDAVDSEASLDGYNAYDRGDEKLGKIKEVIAREDTMQPLYLVVDTGGWFHSGDQFVVPMGEVDHVEDDGQRVYFRTLTKQTLENGAYPAYDEGWWDRDEYNNFSQHEGQVAQVYEPNRSANAPVDYNSKMYQRPAQGAQRLQLMEERLKVDKQRYQAGEVKIGKRITEHQETVSVPVREEHVIVERTQATGDRPADGQKMGANQTVDIPVMKERVNVTKEPVVTGEVNVRKEVTERTEPVQQTVREEEPVIEDDQGLVENRTRMNRDGNGNGNGARRADNQTEAPARGNGADAGNPIPHTPVPPMRRD